MSGEDLLPPDWGPRHLSWTLPSGGAVSASVYGGVRVSTGDLDTLAARLRQVAADVDEARTHVVVQAAQVRGTPSHALSFRQTLPPVPDWLEAGGLQTAATEADVRRRRALDYLAPLADGPGSLAHASTRLRALADAVAAASQHYASTEVATAEQWRPAALGLTEAAWWWGISPVGWIMTGHAGVASTLAGLVPEELRGDVMRRLDRLAPGAAQDSMALNAAWHLSTLLTDRDLASWVVRDLVVLAALSSYAARARTSQEAGVVEDYLRSTAERLDPVLTARLPATIQHGSRRVPVGELTAMQRVTAYIALASAASGAQRFGRRTGVRVTGHGAWSILMPTAAAAPFGLGAALAHADSRRVGAGSGTPPGSTTPVPGRTLTPPATPSDVMRYSDSLKKADTDTTSGVVSVLRTDHADGRRSWLVVVPGTTDWSVGGPNPQDMLTNLEAVAGLPTDMETGVVTAMRAAGIAPGEPVAIYGHSQGAITAANVAADPAVARRFTITTALTVGGPVSPVALPESVHALHIENGADAVAALDAAPNPATPARTTVHLDTSDSGLDGYPHGSLVYAQAMDQMPPDPAVEDWVGRLRSVTGAGEEGAVTREMVFDIERVREPAGS